MKTIQELVQECRDNRKKKQPQYEICNCCGKKFIPEDHYQDVCVDCLKELADFYEPKKETNDILDIDLY